jgi:hypothetical protein
VLIVSPAPSTLHQLAVARLTVLLSAACPDGLVRPSTSTPVRARRARR